ncbi:MAG: hypothetical protein LLG15_01515 [Betaproteobacteria bacterium]|nr:hypothetical protein [Betaproteobacteria bacterium]
MASHLSKIALILCVLLAGCASPRGPEESWQEFNKKWEEFNTRHSSIELSQKCA